MNDTLTLSLSEHKAIESKANEMRSAFLIDMIASLFKSAPVAGTQAA